MTTNDMALQTVADLFFTCIGVTIGLTLLGYIVFLPVIEAWKTWKEEDRR